MEVFENLLEHDHVHALVVVGEPGLNVADSKVPALALVDEVAELDVDSVHVEPLADTGGLEETQGPTAADANVQDVEAVLGCARLLLDVVRDRQGEGRVARHSQAIAMGLRKHAEGEGLLLYLLLVGLGHEAAG